MYKQGKPGNILYSAVGGGGSFYNAPNILTPPHHHHRLLHQPQSFMY